MSFPRRRESWIPDQVGDDKYKNMSRETVSAVIDVLAVLTLVGQVMSVVLIGLLGYIHFGKKNKKLPKFINTISTNNMGAALIVATVATLGSLFLSEGAKFIPCELCWFQRICMYPQVVILGIGVWKNEMSARMYALPLAVIGFLIASYHYALQMYPGLPCTDEVASCAAKQFANFGYITIPMMAWTAFLLIILFLLFPKKK